MAVEVFGFDNIESSFHGKIRLGDFLVFANRLSFAPIQFKHPTHKLFVSTLPMSLKLRRPRAVVPQLRLPLKRVSPQEFSRKDDVSEFRDFNEEVIIRCTNIQESIETVKSMTILRKTEIESLELEVKVPKLRLTISQLASDVLLTLSRIKNIEKRIENKQY